MRWRTVAAIVGLTLGVGFLVFHPDRPLYMQSRDIEATLEDGVTLQGTLSLPRWHRKPAPAVVIVHGSGPIGRVHVLGDTRRLVRLGFAVLAYDKRGAGASGGTYLPGAQWGDSAESALRRLALDAAAFHDRIAGEPDVDSSRVGFFGASQAGWIIPMAAARTRRPPRFNVILSGAAVPTGIEAYYSGLTGDGERTPQVTDRAEVQRLVREYSGSRGYDPTPILDSSRVPTLWVLGQRDESVPIFAAIELLDGVRARGNPSHTVRVYPSAGHSLRDADTGESVPIFDDMMSWLRELGIITAR